MYSLLLLPFLIESILCRDFGRWLVIMLDWLRLPVDIAAIGVNKHGAQWRFSARANWRQNSLCGRILKSALWY